MKYTISFLLLLSVIVVVTCGGVEKPTTQVPQAVKGVGQAAAGAKEAADAKGAEKGKSGNTGNDKKEGDDDKGTKDEDKKRDRRGYVLGYGHYAPAYGLGYHGVGYHHGLGYHGLGYHGLGYHGLGWPYGFHG